MQPLSQSRCVTRLLRIAESLSVCLPLLSPLSMGAQSPDPKMQQVTIAVGVPLHVRVTRTADLRKDEPVEGVLTEPVYVYDRVVLPKDAVVRGSVSGVVPADRKIRTEALLNGDVTPLHDPIVNFTTIRIGDADIVLSSEARIRDAQMVDFAPAGPRPSLIQQCKKQISDRIQSTKNALFAPGKKDRALRLFYSQLPYHPQRIWAGTQFIADLKSTAEVSLSATVAPVIVPLAVSTLDRIVVKARLLDGLSSDVARKGDAVTASVTQPVFNARHELVVAEGTRLEGAVLQSQPSRSFGRNGQLRFVFRSVQRTPEELEQVRGTLTAAEGNSAQNISLDHEGGAKSHPDKNRFVAPLTLAVLTVAGHEGDSDGGLGRNTVASNGLGLIARVIALTVNSRNVATGFGAYAFAKSIYFRFVARGHAVTFPKDTLVQVQLNARR